MQGDPSKDELVDDRALRSADDDAFGHVHFVDELAGLVRSVPTPANIAVYAPWGAGKSGLAHLLKERLATDPSVRFVRFDAFKYAEAPLRRQFLSQLAQDLEVRNPDRYSRALYTAEVSNELEFPKERVRGLLRIFAAVLLALMAGVLAAACVYAAFATGDPGPDFRAALAWGAPKAFVPAALLGIVAALAGDQFKVTRQVDPPKTDEEFESRFRELVEEAIRVGSPKSPGHSIDDTRRRMVVFIDELDRCSPDEVVSTLETIRTFLEVEGCVFVVAADQHAIEEALTREVRQATPVDAAAPYYSGGSAYLDKIFQYQLQLPPLKPQRLTSFAMGLVQDKQGVWERVRTGSDLGDVISVLVPTHVGSPRRVKALLNNYALMYRIAESRVRAGRLAPNLGDRAAELAKLVCLRLEFPLFAADLSLDPRMPDLVRCIADGDAVPEGIRDDVEHRAELWAHGKLAADQVLADEAGANEAGALAVGEVAEGGTDLAAVREGHTNQLIRYLQKTADVPGPRRDLIYLESAGALLEGLDPAVADDLERAAVDGARDEARETVASLVGEGQRSAYRVLAHVVGHSSIGVEGGNAIQVLLAALEVRTVELGDVADEAARAISRHRYRLRQHDLFGALSLASQSSHAAARELRSRVLEQEVVLEDADLRNSVVRMADTLIDAAPARFSEIAARSLMEEGGAASLRGLELDWALRVVQVAEPVVSRLLNAADDGGQDGPAVLDGLGNTFDELIADGGPALSESFAALLMCTGNEDARRVVLAHRESLSAVADPCLVQCVLEQVSDGDPADASAWLSMIDPLAIRDDSQRRLVKDAVARVVSIRWTEYVGGAVSDEEMARLADALAPFHRAGILSGEGQLDPAAEQPSVTSAADFFRRVEQSRLAEQFVDVELMSREGLANWSLMCASAVLQAAQHELNQIDPGAYFGLIDHQADQGSPPAARQLRDDLRSSWTPWPGQTASCVIALSARLRDAPSEGDEADPPYDIPELRELVASHPEDMTVGVTTWLGRFAESAADVFAVLEPLLSADPRDGVRLALGRRVKAWGDTQDGQRERTQFHRQLVSAFAASGAAREWLVAARLDDDAAGVVDRVVELYDNGNATAATSRKLLAVWEVLGAVGDVLQRKLVNGLYAPLARTGSEDDYHAAKDHVGLLRNVPADRRKAVRDALRQTAQRIGDESELEQKFAQAGLKTEKKWFGLSGGEDV